MAVKAPANFAYLHQSCGTVTQVSQDIVENMHADPYFYSPGKTICASCGEVPDRECTIAGSGESLDTYCKRLCGEKGPAYHAVRFGIYGAFIVLGVIVGAIIGSVVQGNLPLASYVVIGGIVGLALGFVAGKWLRLALCKAGAI